MKKQIKGAWDSRNYTLTITRFQAALFLLLAILPMNVALAILDNRTTALTKMMDGAVQGLVMQRSAEYVGNAVVGPDDDGP